MSVYYHKTNICRNVVNYVHSTCNMYILDGNCSCKSQLWIVISCCFVIWVKPSHRVGSEFRFPYRIACCPGYQQPPPVLLASRVLEETVLLLGDGDSQEMDTDGPLWRPLMGAAGRRSSVIWVVGVSEHPTNPPCISSNMQFIIVTSKIRHITLPCGVLLSVSVTSLHQHSFPPGTLVLHFLP